MNCYESPLWYDLSEISELLKEKSANQYNVYDKVTHNSNFNNLLTSVIEQSKANNDVKPIVIPLDVSNSNEDPYGIPHWVALVIKINGNGNIKALYCDSIGYHINKSLLSALKNNKIEICDYSKRQHQKLSDCGPWTVFNLDNLAKNNQLPDGIDDTAINDQRSRLMVLKKEIQKKKFEKKLLSKDITKEEHDKINDLKELNTILNAILDFENSKTDLKNTILIIGEASAKVSYNDKGDKDSIYIRNKYGYIQRNKSKNKNINGIYFERLSNFVVIIKNEQLFSSIDQSEFESIKNDLCRLKQKLAHIFKEENFSINHLPYQIDADFTASISSLTDLSAKYYEIMILQLIKSENNNLEPIDFNNKDDRYYFARAFCIIGELLNELIEDKNKDSINEFVLESFKNLINIRNSICHLHKTILNGTIDKNERINEIIVEIRNHLKEVICEDPNDKKRLMIYNQYSYVNKFQEDSQNLLTYLTQKEKKESVQDKVRTRNAKKEKIKENKTVSIEESKNIMDKLIKKACIFIKGVDSNSKIKSTVNITNKITSEKQLRTLDIVYQPHYQRLTDYDKSHYPSALNLENQDRIFLEEKRIDDKPSTHATALINEKDIDVKIDKINMKLDAIQEEVTYLLSLTEKAMNSHPNEKKYEFIFQNIMMVIGQSIRDIEEINVCHNKTEKSSESKEYIKQNLPHFHKFSKSLFLTEGKIICKESRVRGLAHNIHSFDRSHFYEDLKDILNVSSHLDSFSFILKKESIPPSALSLHNIGVSLSEIGLYYEAIKYLDEALKLTVDQPKDDYNTNLDSMAKDFVEVIGLPRLVYQIRRNLIIFLFVTNQFERAHSELETILKEIDLKKLSECGNIVLKHEVNSLFCDLGHYYINKGDLHQAVIVLEQAESISEDFLTKLFLAKTYFYLKEYEKSKNLCNIIFQCDPDIVGKFQSLEVLIHICLDMSDLKNVISEITHYLNLMKQLFQTDNRSFKFLYRDRYLLSKLIIIEMELNLLIEEPYQGLNESTDVDINLSRLETVDKEFCEIMNKIGEEVMDNPQITEIYMLLCCAYCCVYSERCVSFHTSKYLDSAQKYFDLGTKNIARFSNLDSRIKTHAAEAALTLSRAYNSYVIKSTEPINIKTRIEYLMKALLLDQTYKLRKVVTFNNLGLQYLHLANKYFNKYEVNESQEYAIFALTNYDEAIKYYEAKIKELDQESNSAIEIIESKFTLAYCYNGRALLKYDLRLIRDTLIRFEELLNLPISEADRFGVTSYRNITGKLFSDIIEVLKEIEIGFSGNKWLSKVSKYTIDYCKIKFNIRICRGADYIRWTYDGKLSDEELKKQIISESNCLEELRLISEFYKLLIDKGLINQNS